jgi:hypothetical protein
MRNIIIGILGCLLGVWAVPAVAAEVSEPQILAKLGDAVITVQDFLLLTPVLQGIAKQTGVEEAKTQLLEGLIGRELFAREAVRLGLDQSPDVQAKLKQARNNLLAQEYLKWRTAQGVAIGDEEITQYYEAHRDEFEGKSLPDATAQIKAKLTSSGLSGLLAKTKTELRQREDVTIDETLLHGMPVATSSKQP